MGLNRWTCAIASLLLCLGTALRADAQLPRPVPQPPGVRPNQSCAPGAFVTGINTIGQLVCVVVPGGGDMLRSAYDADSDGEVNAAEMARALAANPVGCSPGLLVSDIAADGTLTCVAPPPSTHLDSGTALPSSPTPGRVFIVLDDATEGACASAGGTAQSYCYWDSAAGQWKSPGRVTSVFGRTGAVVATAGDYSAALVTNTPAGGISATTVQAALDELDTEKLNSADAVTTAAASKVPRADGSGKIDDAWLSANVSLLGSSIGATELFDGGTAGVPLVAGGAGGDPSYALLTAVGIDTTQIQRRVGGTCSAGSSIRSINEDGSIGACEADDVGAAGGGYDAVQTDGSGVAKTSTEQLKIAGGTGITTSGADGTPDVVTVAINDAQVATQSELDTHTANVNAHHARDHATTHSAAAADPVSVENLATAGGSGTSPVSSGSGTLAMTNIATQAELDAHIALPNAHHAQQHSLVGSDHTLTGATDGMALQATGATTFSFNWTRLRTTGDCTALTDGIANQVCVNTTGARLYFICRPTAGGCDTVGEWNPLEINEAQVAFATNNGSRHDHVPADIVNATANRCARFNASGVLVPSATGDCDSGDTTGSGTASGSNTGEVQYRNTTAGNFDSEPEYLYDEASNTLTLGRFGAPPSAGQIVVVPQTSLGGKTVYLEGTDGCSPNATVIGNCQSITFQAPPTIGTNRTVTLEDDATPIPGSAIAVGGDLSGTAVTATVVNVQPGAVIESQGDITFATNDGSRHDHHADDIVAGTLNDARVNGALERDEVTPQWNAVIDCTALSFTACQDAFYTALQPYLTAADSVAFNALLPFRMNVVLGDQTCDPDTATDFGDARACLAIFPSGTYSSGRPTPAAKFFNGVHHGAFEVHFDGRLKIDATGGGHSTQAEPILGLLLGDGYFAGYQNFDVASQCTGSGAPTGCCTGAGTGNGTGLCANQPGGVGQWGSINALRVTGHLATQSMDSLMDNASGPDWNTAAGGNGRRPITAHFGDPVLASKTTVVGLVVSGQIELDWSDFHFVHQHSGGDWDDLGFACTGQSFSNTALGSMIVRSGNGGWIGPVCDIQFGSADNEPTNGTSDRLGWVLGSPPYVNGAMKMPTMGSGCASGNCAPRYTPITFPLHSAGMSISEGFRTANFATAYGGIRGEIYTESTLSTLAPLNSGCTAPDVPWDCCTGSGTGTCWPKDFILGFGVCAVDGSMCTEEQDCPKAAGCTGAGQPWPCCTGAGAGATCQLDTSPNGECTGAGLPYFCCTAAGVGTCQGSQPSNANQCQGANANTSVDSEIRGTWSHSMLGLGPNAKAPYSTGPGPAIGLIGFATTGGPEVNSLCTASGAPIACCTGSGTGTCPDFAINSGVNVDLAKAPTLDFTGSQMSQPKSPANYTGTVIPPVAVIYSADCPAVANGVLGQECVDTSGGNIGVRYACDPDAGPGTSNHLCDTANDWIAQTVGPTVETAEVTDGTLTGDDVAASIAGDGLVKDTAATPDELDVNPGLGLRLSSDAIGIDPTAALTGDHSLASGEGKFGANGFVFEGATADTIEQYISVTDPVSADRTTNLGQPDANSTTVEVKDCGSGNYVRAVDADGDITCAADVGGGGGATAISSITDAAGTNSIANAEFGQVWTWDTADAAAAFDGLTLAINGDATSGSTVQRVLRVVRNDTTGSQTVQALIRAENLDTDGTVTSGILVAAATNTLMTVGLDVSDAEIVTAIAIGQNEITANGLSVSGAELSVLDGEITLGTETAGNYATSASEGGPATSAVAMSGSGQIDDDDLASGAVDGGAGGEIADGTLTYEDFAKDAIGTDHGASAIFFGSTALIFEGSTNDTIEGQLTAADPTGSDQTWTLPDASGTIALIAGDLTTGSVISNGAVSLAKLANIPTNSLIGRDTPGSGVPENITLNSTLELDTTQVLRRAALTGDVTASAGSNSTTIADSVTVTGWDLGASTATTPADNDNDTSLATTAMVSSVTKSIWIPSGALEVDGTNCTYATAGVLNSGPFLRPIACTENAASIIYFDFVSPDNWDLGTFTVEGAALTIDASITGGNDDSWGFDVSCQVRRGGNNGDTPNSTWGTAQNLDFVFDTQYEEQHITTAAITANGTAAAGAHIYCRMVNDTGAATDSVPADFRMLGVKVEYGTASVSD